MAAMRVTVRRATRRDLDYVHRDREIPARRMRRMVAEGCAFVATAEGRRVGVARLDYLWGKTPFLTSLWVEPESRRVGVARTLLDSISRRLARQGLAELYSSTMPDNPAGLRWHRALGFTRCGFIAGINPGGVGEVFFVRRLSLPA
jgi:ribosomal protein S18 acetylase RimI-like enzyme